MSTPRRSARLASKKAANTPAQNSAPRRSARLASKEAVNAPPQNPAPDSSARLASKKAANAPPQNSAQEETKTHIWPPVSEEEYTKSHNYVANNFVIKKEDCHYDNRKFIVDVFTYFLSQPIVLAKHPHIRFILEKKLDDLIEELYNSRNLELMARFAPLFIEFKELFKRIHLHPWYTE
jgi:hypothetical protein